MPDPGYCKLYVNARVRVEQLVDFIRKETAGFLNHDYVDCEWGSFYVFENDEHSRWKTKGEHGFLFYRYIVEVNPWESRDFGTYVRSLRELIGHLRMLPAQVVAACDFEDQLDSGEAKA
jgi:hypothetical protein